jgi:hypothetical protein
VAIGELKLVVLARVRCGAKTILPSPAAYPGTVMGCAFVSTFPFFVVVGGAECGGWNGEYSPYVEEPGVVIFDDDEVLDSAARRALSSEAFLREKRPMDNDILAPRVQRGKSQEGGEKE